MARLPDPLYNNGPGFRSATLTSKTFGMSHELNGAAIITVKTVGQQWNINIQYNTMTHSQFAPLDAFLGTLGGNMESFEVVLPQYRQLGVPDLGVSSTSTPGERTVSMDSVSGLSVGMLIQFNTGTKVYKITDITGLVITLNSGLYSTVTSTSTAKVSDIQFTCKLTSMPDVQTNEDNLISGFSLQMKETVI